MVEFYVCGERLALEEGGCYYVNVNLPHRVNNRGTKPRVHMVIDAAVDDWSVSCSHAAWKRVRRFRAAVSLQGASTNSRRWFLRTTRCGKNSAPSGSARTLALGGSGSRSPRIRFERGDAEAACRAKPSAGAASVPGDERMGAGERPPARLRAVGHMGLRARSSFHGAIL